MERKIICDPIAIPSKIWEVLSYLQESFTITSDGIEFESEEVFKLISYKILPPSEKIKHLIETKQFAQISDVLEEIKVLEQFEEETFYRLTREDLKDPFDRVCKEFSICDKEKLFNFVFSKIKKSFFIEDWDICAKITIESIIDRYKNTVMEVRELSPAEIRKIDYDKCQLCTSKEMCECTSIAECRKKIELSLLSM